MFDYKKPIPVYPFPSNKLPVPNPSLEPMVYLDDDFICDSMYNHWVEDEGRPLPGSSPSIMARETVYNMLLEAAKLLPEGYKFKIYDAYRPIAVQQALWDYFRAVKREENPDVSEEEVDRLTLFCISFPSYNVLMPSLHNTGAAVDLTIVGPDGEELDMGCGFDEFTDAAWTTYFEAEGKGAGLNDIARDNRRLLYNIMTEVGFTNFPSEWWHFDYGTEKWGLFTNNVPVYGGILDAEVKDSVPYENMDVVRSIDKKEQDLVKQIVEMREQFPKLEEEVVKVVKG